MLPHFNLERLRGNSFLARFVVVVARDFGVEARRTSKYFQGAEERFSAYTSDVLALDTIPGAMYVYFLMQILLSDNGVLLGGREINANAAIFKNMIQARG